MERREFINFLGGAAAAWPLAARAQSERIRRIGMLHGGAAADDPDAQIRIELFLQVLQQLGWTAGRNVQIDYRWGLGDAANIRKYAAELAAFAPDVILTSGSLDDGCAAAGDPRGADCVRECHRPGRGRLRR